MDLPVTLIVKAPNQQIEDQTVQCEPSWTINKLKQHLSEVYPSKPPKNEQKLIYSGKLLNDSVILKDILRQYEGQDTHTVHLVCTPKYSPQQQSRTATRDRDMPQLGDARTEGPQRQHQPDNQHNPTATATDQRVPNMQWYNQFQMPQNLQDISNMDPQMMQMIMMQQAFMQAYYTQYQYMNMQNYNQPQTTVAQPPEAAPIPQQPQQVANAPNIQRDDREPNRDWLDIFYLLSRSMIFISIVYFYSSPVRCLVVIALAISLYLYQIGFFRNVNINNNNINVQPGDAVPPPIQDGQPPQEPAAPTRLMVLWTFFTTFFASLLPEIPNVV